MKKNALITGIAPVAFTNAATAPVAPVATETKKRVDPIIAAVSKAVPLPERKSKRGSVSIYPFASLTEVGMSFGVTNKTAKDLSSIVSNANRKALVDKVDDKGNTVFKTKPITDANGNVTNVPTNEPEKVATIHYFVIDVDSKTDPDKATARVFRDK